MQFRYQVVSNSGDATTSIDNPDTIGNTQEHLVSLRTSKMNPVCGRYTHVNCNVSNEAAILELIQPY